MDITEELPTVISLCSGYGGIERGLELAGYNHRLIAFCEIEAYVQKLTLEKMEKGHMVPAPLWTNLKTFPAQIFRDKVDVMLAGYPCQPFSQAGQRGGKMIHDTCGPISRNTSEQLDLFGVSSRTCKDTSRWDSPQSSQIWKNWVIEQRGEYSQRKKSALLIKEKECLSWPTPEAWTVQKYSLQKDGQEKTQRSKNLTAMALNGELSQPDQNKSNMNGKNQELSNWPTPTKSDMKDTWNGGRGETLVSKIKEKRSGKLNPDWCEQLMGLPVGWTKIDDADDRISRLMAIGNGVVPQTAALAWVTLSEKIKQ